MLIGPSFECHITVPSSSDLPAAAIAAELGWKTSEIARDPLLGDKNFFYLTGHARDLVLITAEMRQVVERLVDAGVPVLREKIEVIIHDVRY